eukprot:1940705-Pleurochrysis_carterae.AAC.1
MSCKRSSQARTNETARIAADEALRSTTDVAIEAKRGSPQRGGGYLRRVSTCYGRSPSAHIVAAMMRRVERRFREMRRDAQLPEA